MEKIEKLVANLHDNNPKASLKSYNHMNTELTKNEKTDFEK